MLLQTQRLFIEPLSVNHLSFMQTLTNTKGWLNNIGDRQTTTQEGAIAYLNKVLASGNPHFVINLETQHTPPIGIVSFMQRPSLKHPDIGYALLDNYIGQGYAFEAVNAVLQQLIKLNDLEIVLAQVLPTNTSSINLLLRLGFEFESEITENEKLLHIYQLNASAFLQAQNFLIALKSKQHADPLHGKTLEVILTELQQQLGWDSLADKVPINCFINNPSIKSSLTFLRKTPWARKRVEQLWLNRFGWQE
jgi:[ribosomal protein S5]-alanine N-acetyltransferase